MRYNSALSPTVLSKIIRRKMWSAITVVVEILFYCSRKRVMTHRVDKSNERKPAKYKFYIASFETIKTISIFSYLFLGWTVHSSPVLRPCNSLPSSLPRQHALVLHHIRSISTWIYSTSYDVIDYQCWEISR